MSVLPREPSQARIRIPRAHKASYQLRKHMFLGHACCDESNCSTSTAPNFRFNSRIKANAKWRVLSPTLPISVCRLG